MSPWYERQPQRLDVEARLLRQTYPEAQMVKDGGLIRARLIIQGQRGLYLSELVYPNQFPHQLIKAYIRQPRLESSPHQYLDGSPCLFHGDEVGPQTTGVVIVGVLKEWIKRYEEYLQTGEWRD